MPNEAFLCEAPNHAINRRVRHIPVCPRGCVRFLEHHRVYNDHRTPISKESRTLLKRLAVISYVMQAARKENHVEGTISQRNSLVYMGVDVPRIAAQSLTNSKSIEVCVQIGESDVRPVSHVPVEQAGAAADLQHIPRKLWKDLVYAVPRWKVLDQQGELIQNRNALLEPYQPAGVEWIPLFVSSEIPPIRVINWSQHQEQEKERSLNGDNTPSFRIVVPADIGETIAISPDRRSGIVAQRFKRFHFDRLRLALTPFVELGVIHISQIRASSTPRSNAKNSKSSGSSGAGDIAHRFNNSAACLQLPQITDTPHRGACQ